MTQSFDVRVYKIEHRRWKTGVTYRLRWKVDGSRRQKTFSTSAQADSFRSEIVAAARRGEAFDVITGLPVAMVRSAKDLTWYEFAVQYADLKWKDSAAKSRRSRAEALTAITTALVESAGARSRPDGKVLRESLNRWAFNSRRRGEPMPPDVEAALKWVADNSPQVAVLERPEVIRSVLDGLAGKLDGTAAGPNYYNRRRMVLSNAINYAIEAKLLTDNPLKNIDIKRGQYTKKGIVDRRSVVNPDQARALLDAVAMVQRTGPRLVAFFGLLYYAALRPEEAVELATSDITLPASGWGEIHLSTAAPDVGRDWTDSGGARDKRGLKHRAPGESRPVPCPPRLTNLLHDHLRTFGAGRGGRLFWGERGGSIDSSTYERVWKKARCLAFGDEVASKSMLARTPYDLRHAAVSTWLNAGVPVAQVAEWAGHSVAVLLRVYAKCIDGQQDEARRRIDDALKGGGSPESGPTPSKGVEREESGDDDAPDENEDMSR